MTDKITGYLTEVVPLNKICIYMFQWLFNKWADLGCACGVKSTLEVESGQETGCRADPVLLGYYKTFLGLFFWPFSTLSSQ